MERAFSYAASAVAAGVFVDLDFSVHYFCCFVWTGGFDGTFFAAFTDIGVHLGDFLADDADIVQVWLDTVVWAAAYCNLKFVGKGNIPVAFVEALVDFLGNGVGIQKSVLAGGSLAGYYRTDFGSGYTSYPAFFGDKLLEFLNLIIGNPLNFHGKSGGV